MGVSQNQKKLDFKQLNVCKCCGKYSNIEVYMTYWYFMFFFIPIIKWNKEYYIKTSCCEKVSKIAPEIGRRIEKGEEVNNLNKVGGRMTAYLCDCIQKPKKHVKNTFYRKYG